MGPEKNSELLRIAKCGRVVGLKGEIALWPISNVEERYEVGSQLIVDENRVLEIVNVRPKKDHLIVKFSGLSTREDVEDLVNKVLYGEPLTEEALEPGEFFIHDCIGKQVVDSNGVKRGKAQKYIPNTSSDLLELESGVLVPFKFIDRIENGIIYLEEPDGLFDIEDKDYS